MRGAEADVTEGSQVDYGEDVPQGDRADGDLWVDTKDGTVRVWSASAGQWFAAVDPAGRGGFFGDGRTGLEGETPEERWRKEAERGDADEVRLGPHWAKRTKVEGGDGLWVCEICGNESGDAGILAETDCGPGA